MYIITDLANISYKRFFDNFYNNLDPPPINFKNNLFKYTIFLIQEYVWIIISKHFHRLRNEDFNEFPDPSDNMPQLNRYKKTYTHYRNEIR